MRLFLNILKFHHNQIKVLEHMKKIILIGLFALTCYGCTPPEPEYFGVPQSQWVTLTKQQQAEVIKGYNERQAIAKQNEPLESAIGTAGSLLQQAQDYKCNNTPAKPPVIIR